MIDEKMQDTPIPSTEPPSTVKKASAWRRLLSQSPADLQQRRARHRKRPMVVRLAVAVSGGLLAIVGLPVLVIAPDVGIPLLLVALGLLSLEFDWAARLVGQVITQAARSQTWFQRFSQPIRVSVGIAVLGLITLGIWILFLR
jgi:hypothetical protein